MRVRVSLPAMLLVSFVMAGLCAAPAFANPKSLPTPADLPDYSAGKATPSISADLPWLKATDTYFNGDRSVYWNQNFRGGIGQVRITPVHYLEYDYNNKSNSADNGKMRELHHLVTLAGSPFPMTRLFVSAGVNTISIERGSDANTQFENLIGLTFEGGLELGIPIINLFSINVQGRYRQFESAKRSDSVANFDILANGYEWHGQILVVFELPFSTRSGITLDVFAGVGYHYVKQNWKFAPSTAAEQITPDNGSATTQQNGPSRIDIIAGIYFQPVEWLAITIDARFVGPFNLLASIGVIF